jgi:hypothetical protein
MNAQIESGPDISPVNTPRFAAEAYESAFSALPAADTGKVILNWR